MICKNCGKKFEGQFCPDCGTQAVEEVTTCPKCGQERIGDGKFCASCGFNFEEQPKNNDEGKSPNKAKSIFYKIYRFLIAGGMLFLGIVSFLCLTAPTLVEEFLGETNSLCTGFAAIGNGADVDVPSSVVNASKMLLVLSIVALVYGAVQLVFAIKKPYKTIKNYACWAIDGVISIILLALGAVVASATKSEELMEAKLGSGFAMCIVMGVFGILFLAGRIVFELKFFKLEETGLTQEQIAKTGEKKARKKLTKKQIMGITMPIVVVAVLIAVIVPTMMWATNIFRVGKVDKINIGDSQDQVIKILGEPYEQSDYRFEYYSDNYIKVKKQIDKLNDKELGIGGIELLAKSDDEFDFDDDDFDWDDEDFGEDQETKLQEKLRTMTYQYICIEFDADQKVSSVFFDAERCDDKEYKKVVESYDIQGETELQQYETLKLFYSVKYDDGSFYKSLAVNQILLDLNQDNVKWKDIYGNEYNTQLKVTPFTILTEKIVTILAGDEKSTLTEFVVTENVTSIGDYAFSSCSNLTHIEIPSSVTSIGNYAFSNCSNLTHIEIPSNVTSIGDYAFYNCSSFTIIEIPSSVIKIGDNAFYNCSSLESIMVDSKNTKYISDENCLIEKSTNKLILGCKNSIVPNYITRIDNNAFSSIDSSYYNEYENGRYLGNKDNPYLALIDVININFTTFTINKDTKFIYSYTFSECSSLTSIEIPSGVISIGACAFSSCSSLESVSIPSSVTIIEDRTFEGCYSLENIFIPNSVTSIGKEAFSCCYSLIDIEIPSSVTSIGNGAFSYCENLERIVIPRNVTSIGYGAFVSCSYLTIYCEVKSQPSGWDSDWYEYYMPVVWGYEGQ